MEATLASRTAQQRAEAEAGKGDALRRQAEQERQAKARHEAAMARRRAEGELASAVEKHARDLAARIEDALAGAVTIGDLVLPLSATAGVAIAEAGDDPRSALARADLVMYQRKRSRPPRFR